jgi:hypothetical protein
MCLWTNNHNIHLHWLVDLNFDLTSSSQTIGEEIPNGGTFYNMYARDHICVVYKCYKTWIIAPKKFDLRFKSLIYANLWKTLT